MVIAIIRALLCYRRTSLKHRRDVCGVSYDSPDATFGTDEERGKKKKTIESNDRKGSARRYLDRKDILERCSWLSANRARKERWQARAQRSSRIVRPGPLRPASRTNERRGRSEETTEWPRVALDSLHPAAARICSRLLHLPSHRAASALPRTRRAHVAEMRSTPVMQLGSRYLIAAPLPSNRVGQARATSTDTSTDTSASKRYRLVSERELDTLDK